MRRAELNRDNTVLISCEMIEDEVREAMRRTGADFPIIWVERGYHDKPDNLRKELQLLIRYAEANYLESEVRTKEHVSPVEPSGVTAPSAANGSRRRSRRQEETKVTDLEIGSGHNDDLKYILLAFGLCGKGIAGLESDSAVLAVPRFDDCVNIMLCPEKREKRAYMKAGVTYMTHGWTSDAGSMKNMYKACVERYGERRGKRAFSLMFDSYTTAAVVEDGCYDLPPVEKYAEETADLLNLKVEHVPGYIHVFEDLVGGNWNDNIVVSDPGRKISEEDFNFGGEAADVSTTAMNTGAAGIL